VSSAMGPTVNGVADGRSRWARAGGMGVLHRNLPVAEQGRPGPRTVKRSEAGMGHRTPSPCSPDNTRWPRSTRCARGFRISGLPVVDDTGELVGIITNRDMRFEVDQFQARLRGDDQGAADHPRGRAYPPRRRWVCCGATRLIEAGRFVDGHGKLTGLITVKDFVKNRAVPVCPPRTATAGCWSARPFGGRRRFVDSAAMTLVDGGRRTC